ncbi:MAG: M55 family metallopeptidase, partial [Halanaerobiaceae bacterium]
EVIKIKIYILTDLEGVAGVSKFEHCSTSGQFFLRSQRLLTEEVNAAVEGSFLAGAEEVVVWDGHGPGGMNPEILHKEARLITGSVIDKNCGLDKTFDAMMVIGQHAMNRVPEANLCHTYSSRGISEMRLNDNPIGELGMRTIMAGFLEVPVIFVSGDDKACKEAEDMVPEVETTAVKNSLGREAAIAYTPQKAREKIKKGVIKAIARKDEIKPYTEEPPFVLETDYFEVDPENPDDRSWDRPIEKTEVEKSDDFLELAR